MGSLLAASARAVFHVKGDNRRLTIVALSIKRYTWRRGGGGRGRQHTRPQKDLGDWSCGPMHCPCKHNRSQFCDFHAHFSGHNAESPPPATEHKGKLADLSDANTDDEGAPAAVCSEAPQNSKRGHKLKTECRESICSTHLVLTSRVGSPLQI